MPGTTLAREGEKLRWTVQTVGSPPIQGFIDDIGYLIDPNQHTAVVKGHIDNPGERLRAGQFVSATVDLLPPDGVVEVPMDAVVEDGQQAVVFVQTDPNEPYYTMRRVEVTAPVRARTMFVREQGQGHQAAADPRGTKNKACCPSKPCTKGTSSSCAGRGS